MAYTTHSDSSPENNTSYINTGLVSLVPNNPYNPNATTINWPSNYDLFVNKTNDQQVSVSVSDETHAVSEITADSGLYLNHKPRRGTTITTTDGVIDTGLTDYNHGVIYFSTLPTAEVTLTYLADPDKYYGEYLTQIQDVLHEMQIWAGAGGTLNEGVRSAEILVKSTNDKISTKLPNRIHVQGLSTGISFQSAAGNTTGVNVNIGNSYDTVSFNVQEFNLFRGTLNDGNTGDPVTATITDHSGDTVFINGLVSLSPTGATRATGISYNQMTGALFTTASGRDGGNNDALRVFGDTFIAGDLYTMGNHTVQNVTTTSSFNVFVDNIKVKGDSLLGDATTDSVYISGPTVATGKITAKDHIEVTKSISFTNNNGTAVSTVDGLDASYIANRHTYMRPGGPDWCGDSVNICSIGSTFGTGSVVGGYAGSTTHASVNGSTLIDTSVTTNALFTGPFYYAGRFDDGTWTAEITSGPDVGQKVPIAKWDATATGWVLSRSLSTNQSSGVSYRVYNKYFCEPDFVTINGTNFDVSASATDPIVGDVRGIVKVCSADISVSFSAAAAGKRYLFMSNEASDSLNSLESSPVWYTKDHNVPSDNSILVAELNVTAPSTVDANSLRIYRPSSKFDTTWFTADGLPAEFDIGGSYYRFYHNIGGQYRLGDIRFTVLDAGSGSEPDLDAVIYRHVNDDSASNYHVRNFTTNSFEIRLSGVGTTWKRIIAEVR